jgi:hypothetical protein
LLALFYCITNGIPLLRDLDSVPAPALVRFAGALLLPPLLWAWFFLKPQPRATMAALLAGLIPQTLESWVRIWPTFSLLSLDSIFYVFTGALPPLAYAWFLTATFRGASVRRAAYLLWILTTFQALAALANAGMALIGAAGSLASFWNADPLRTFWTLFASPAILTFYWGSQSWFFRAVRRARP